MKLEYSRQILEKNSQLSNFMKFYPVVAKVLHADRQMDRQDEVNIRSLQFCEHT
jgi:hypothetical protein